MNLCLVMIGRFEKKEGSIYGDKKNINAIERYLKYFDKIYVVARETKANSNLYRRQKVELHSERVIFLLYPELKRNFKAINYFHEFKKQLTNGIKKSDVVLCWSEAKANYIVKFSKKQNKTTIVYVGGCNKDILMSSKSFKRKAAGVWIYFSNKSAIEKADFVHYVTDNELQKRYPTKGKSIGASYVKVETNLNSETKQKRFDLYNSESKVVTLGTIGYLNEVKGIDTAIYALSIIEKNVSLRVLGGGDSTSYENLAKKLGVEDRVFFDGTLDPGADVLKWLEKIDIYIQPSRTEGLPRATIEAMSQGCPIISSDVMGLVELVEKDYRHKAGDWKTLANIISKLSNNPYELKRQAERSFNVVQRYNRNLLDYRIDLFFDEILDSTNL